MVGIVVVGDSAGEGVGKVEGMVVVKPIVCCKVGHGECIADGVLLVGNVVGICVGYIVGITDGITVGKCVGIRDGWLVGL